MLNKLFRLELKLLASQSTHLATTVLFIFVSTAVLWYFDTPFSLVYTEMANLDKLFELMSFLMLFVWPTFTMRSFSEDRQKGLYHLQMMYPISSRQMFWAKWCAAMVWSLFSFVVIIGGVISYYYLSFPAGNLDLGVVLSQTIGFFLWLGLLTSVGLFISIRSSSSILAYIITLLMSSLLWFGFELLASYTVVGQYDFIVRSLGVQRHVEEMNKGVISLTALLYLVGITVLFASMGSWYLRQKKHHSIALFSQIKRWGIAIACFVAAYQVAESLVVRLDMTQDGRFSLKPATKGILKEIDHDIEFQIFLKGDFPSAFQSIATETERLIQEFKFYNRNISYKFIDVLDTAEVNALQYDLTEAFGYYQMMPQIVRLKEKGGIKTRQIYPWAFVRRDKKLYPVALFDVPDQIPQYLKINTAMEKLEYNFINAIHHLYKTKRQKIGYLYGHGEAEHNQVFSFIKDISQKYDVIKLKLKDTLIESGDDDIKNFMKYDLLMVNKPSKPFSETHKLLLDQYLMQGGKILWLVDQIAIAPNQLQTQGSTIGVAMDLGLFDMFFRYGVRVNPSLTMDLDAAKLVIATGTQSKRKNFVDFRWPYFPSVLGDTTGLLSKPIEKIWIKYGSTLDTILSPKVKKTPLLIGSEYMKIRNSPVEINFNMLKRDINYKSFNKKYLPFGYLLEGRFTSAYANRIKPFELTKPIDTSVHTRMAIIGDGDLILNDFKQKKPQPVGLNKWTNIRYGNQNFAEKLIAYLLGEEYLLSVDNKSYQLTLINQKEIKENGSAYQWLNIALATLLATVLYIVIGLYRKKRYTRG